MVSEFENSDERDRKRKEAFSSSSDFWTKQNIIQKKKNTMGTPLVAQMYIECMEPQPIFKFQTNDRSRLTFKKCF